MVEVNTGGRHRKDLRAYPTITTIEGRRRSSANLSAEEVAAKYPRLKPPRRDLQAEIDSLETRLAIVTKHRNQLVRENQRLRDGIRERIEEWTAVDAWGAGVAGKGSEFAEELHGLVKTVDSFYDWDNEKGV